MAHRPLIADIYNVTLRPLMLYRSSCGSSCSTAGFSSSLSYRLQMLQGEAQGAFKIWKWFPTVLVPPCRSDFPVVAPTVMLASPALPPAGYNCSRGNQKCHTTASAKQAADKGCACNLHWKKIYCSSLLILFTLLWKVKTMTTLCVNYSAPINAVGDLLCKVCVVC